MRQPVGVLARVPRPRVTISGFRRLLSRALALAILFSVIVAGVAPQRALAYCYGLSSQAGVTFGGGVHNLGLFEIGYQAITGYIYGRLPDPVPNASTAWYMLHDQNLGSFRGFAQAGWLRRASFGATYYKFAAWADVNGNYYEYPKWSSPNPSMSHSYQVDNLPNNAYEFTFDTVPWLDTLPNQGWYPNQITGLGETHDRADHFPGSVGYEVELWGIQYKRDYSWFAGNMESVRQGFTEIPGILMFSGSDYLIWDSRCSDAG